MSTIFTIFNMLRPMTFTNYQW